MGPGYIGNVVAYIALGIEASAVGIVGLTWDVAGVAALLGFGGLLAWHWYVEGRIESWELGLVAGLLAQFALIAVVRARFNWEGAADPHYVYVGVVYLLPLIATALKRYSWNRVSAPFLVVGVLLAVLANATLLANRAVEQKAVMQTENAELRVVELFRAAPDLALDRALDDKIMPQLTARRYLAAIDQLGSPVPFSTPSALEKLPPQAVDDEMVTLFGGAVSIKPATALIATRSCSTASGSAIDVQVPDGQAIAVVPSRSGSIRLTLGVLAAPSSRPLLIAPVGEATPQLIQMPNTGKPVIWRVRIDASSLGDLQICRTDALQASHP
jgi:hypothetical protein